MKKLIAATALAVGLMTTAGAAQAADLKVAVFDAQEVINGTNAAKKAVQTLNAKRDAAQSKINALEKPLVEKQAKLREQRGVMAADKFQQAEADFAKEIAKFRTQAQQIQTELDSENLKFRKQIADAVRQAVEGIAKEKGYDLVLPKGMTFYISPNVTDISADALAKANKLLDK